MVIEMPNPHSRSASVTAAATLALLCCGSVFLIWGYFFLSFLNAPVDEHGRHLYQLHPGFFLFVALVPPGVIALGIRTGIGLFQLRPWARVGALIWASITLLLCLGLIAMRPFETFFISDRFVGEMESLKQLIAIAAVIFLLPVSVWWLFLFRMKSVKQQFRADDTDEAKEGAIVTGGK